jgi:hypothetical protein
VKAQNFIPHQIVFLTPGAGPVESQAVVVSVVGHLHPLLGKFLRGFVVLLLFNIFDIVRTIIGCAWLLWRHFVSL